MNSKVANWATLAVFLLGFGVSSYNKYFSNKKDNINVMQNVSKEPDIEFKTDSVSVNLIQESRSGIYAIDILQLKRKPYRYNDEDNISAWLRFGHFYYFHGNYDKALENFFKVLEECKTRKVSVGGMPFREISKCYFDTQDYQNAYIYGLKACKEDEKLTNSKNPKERKEGKHELCSDYLLLYKILLLKEKEKEAEEIMKKGIKLAGEIKRKDILIAIHEFGSEYYKDKNPVLSKEYEENARFFNEKREEENNRRLENLFGPGVIKVNPDSVNLDSAGTGD